ncbi:MAG TPA: glycosyltransferase [Steroidobacteraceae bacterium]|jgi:dolichol-phosphate mannosyltransferase|nr:glycosyltransferase [Steroidobacteraceae bacterium]
MAPDAPAFDGAGLSVVVPFFEEGPIVDSVLDELRHSLPRAEIVAVDDGSRDDTWSRILAAPGVRGVRFTRNQGQSAAMYWGLKAATQPLVGVMDGDGQNDPASFAGLVRELRAGNADVACGYRARRRDTWSRRAASRIANAIRRAILDDGARDTGCSQKVFRREHADLLVPFRGMHRYLPAIFRQAGLRIVEVEVNHRPRSGGRSKYSNWRRALDGIYDLFGVAWLLDRKLPPPTLETKP